MRDIYLEQAKKLAKKYKISSEDAIFSLRTDLREINNHMIPLGEEYVNYALENNLYEKDPYCKNRPNLFDLEMLFFKLQEIENFDINNFKYNPHKLFIKKYSNPKEALEERAIII